MVRVDDVGDVECLGGGLGGLLAVDEVEEVGGAGEIRADGGEGEVVAGAVVVGVTGMRATMEMADS